jgi:DNA-binding phage protein
MGADNEEKVVDDANAMAEKAKLRQIIDRNGGVSAVARKSGIPRPSLSRMLNSPANLRRSTLSKIAKAVCLPKEDVASPS